MIAALLFVVAAVPVHTVDLQAAVLATADGRRARARLEEAVEEANERARARRDRLLARSPNLSPQAFESARRETNRQIEQDEARLRALEAKLLDPILDELESIVAKARARREAVILDIAPGRVAGSPKACDLTPWLVARYAGRPAPFPEAGCTPRMVVRVDPASAVRGTPAAREIVGARDAFRERKTRELAKLGSDPRDAARATEIRRQVELRDEAARDALDAALAGALTVVASRHPETVWLAVDAARAPEGACDGTSLVRAELGVPRPGASDCRFGPD